MIRFLQWLLADLRPRAPVTEKRHGDISDNPGYRELDQGDVVRIGDRALLDYGISVPIDLEEARLDLKVSNGARVFRPLDREWSYEI